MTNHEVLSQLLVHSTDNKLKKKTALVIQVIASVLSEKTHPKKLMKTMMMIIINHKKLRFLVVTRN